MIAPNTHRNKTSERSRANTEMDILENPLAWLKNFQEGWLDHFNKTGMIDWRKYLRPRNKFAPSGPGVILAESRLMLISSAGAYIKDTQAPFDSANPFGDYSMRVFPTNVSFDELAYAHEHYDTQYVEADPQVLLPLRHLEEMEADGTIGELSPRVISFSGYHPNVLRVVKELIPAILAAAKEDQVNAALLVPT